MSTSQTKENHNTSSLPEFELESTQGTIKSSDLLGNPSVLVFYPEDESPVCSSQLSIYNEGLRIFDKYNTKIIAISVDDLGSHQKFSKLLNLKFPLVADTNPKGELAKKLDVFNEDNRRSKRAILVFDQDGQMVHRQIYPNHINPGAEGIFKGLEKL